MAKKSKSNTSGSPRKAQAPSTVANASSDFKVDHQLTQEGGVPRVRVQDSGTILTIPVLLFFLVVPIISLLWTSEAPRRPFAFIRPRGPSTSTLVPPRVLLVTAHPDDELLFAPTILSLLSDEKKTENSFWTLCLSKGDFKDPETNLVFQGRPLGEIRVEEWKKSWNVLGLEEGKRWILDVPALKDNESVTWDSSAIAEQVEPYVLAHGINTILTFDKNGITQHPNHISIPSGISQLLASKSFTSQLQGTAPPRVFTLKSTSWRSQHGPLSPIIAHLSLSVQTLWLQYRAEQAAKSASTSTKSTDADADASPLVMPRTMFISDIRRYLRAWKALLQHESQISPKTLAFAVFGKYLWVNEWVEVV